MVTLKNKIQNNFWEILNWSILTIIGIIAILMIIGLPHTGTMGKTTQSPSHNSCTDVNKLDGFQYASCYDPSSKTIFLSIKRENSSYAVRKFKVSFVDLASEYYELGTIPKKGERKEYQIPANKNPLVLNINLGISESLPKKICKQKDVFVNYCPIGTGGKNIHISIASIGGTNSSDFIKINKTRDFASDLLSMNLANKEKIWESTCKSDWICKDWGECNNGVQRRSCNDISECAVSTTSPTRVKTCNGECVENWECQWSSCKSGFTFPTCKDLNKCGTFYNVPKKLQCTNTNDCSPNVVCGNWTACDINYNFTDIQTKTITQISGQQSRICADKNRCVEKHEETRQCSTGVDIYTKVIKRCGKNYLEVYNAQGNKTLAILRKATGERNYLNIYFGNRKDVSCEYCSDGRMDGDETGIDCGGSCKSCTTKPKPEKSWWNFLF